MYTRPSSVLNTINVYNVSTHFQSLIFRCFSTNVFLFHLCDERSLYWTVQVLFHVLLITHSALLLFQTTHGRKHNETTKFHRPSFFMTRTLAAGCRRSGTKRPWVKVTSTEPNEWQLFIVNIHMTSFRLCLEILLSSTYVLVDTDTLKKSLLGLTVSRLHCRVLWRHGPALCGPGRWDQPPQAGPSAGREALNSICCNDDCSRHS